VETLFVINSVDEVDIYDGTVFRLREVSLKKLRCLQKFENTPFGKLAFSVLGSNLVQILVKPNPFLPYEL
jgi:hypothetical protein